jgi:hypothetical protein
MAARCLSPATWRARNPHLQFLGDAMNALDMPNDLLRLHLLNIVLDVSCDCHDAVFDGNPDLCGVEAWLELQLIENVLTQPDVTHDELPRLIPAR